VRASQKLAPSTYFNSTEILSQVYSSKRKYTRITEDFHEMLKWKVSYAFLPYGANNKGKIHMKKATRVGGG
jgi:hypothetical protein